MREIKRYYYDTNCNKVENEEAKNHDEIAKYVIENNPKLLEEYKKIRETGVISESVFLVMKGYIYVGETEKNKSAMLSSISLNKKSRDLLMKLKEEEDVYLYDIIKNELNDEQKAQIKKWYNEGMPIDEIINKVMKEMIVLLAPTKKEPANVENDIDERQ